jgi:hypothetical protein
MNLVLDAINDLTAFTDELVSRARCPLFWPRNPPTRTIRLLLVFPTGENHTNFDFLRELNSEFQERATDCHFLFEPVSISSVDFNARLESNKEYLNDFDILSIGGANLGSNWKHPVKRELIISHIVPFWKHGGAVLFLHDSLVTTGVPHWQEFSTYLGVDESVPAYEYESDVVFVGEPEIQLWPFRFPNEINLTHKYHSFQGYSAGEKNIMVKCNPGKGHFYFMGKGHVGLSQLGHMESTQIELNEKKLTANIMVHLVLGLPDT